MNRYAQTIVQLLKQADDKGYSKADLERLTVAYQLASELFTGIYRPSEKTFISHLVGTASILCELHVRGALIVAGLVHAAYEHGDFGTWRKGISPCKRDQLRGALGDEVENYIAKYTTLRWTEITIPSIHAKFRAFGQVDRDVLLIRLANELEDLLDLGILYCHSSAAKQRHYARIASAMTDMAEKIGFPGLAGEIEESVGNTRAVKSFEGLGSRHKGVRLVVPGSYTRRAWNRAGQLCIEALSRVCGLRNQSIRYPKIK